MTDDSRWKQRFGNYLCAFAAMQRAVDLARQRDLSELEQQGLIQAFEFTHELAWNVLKDYLEEMGIAGIIGSKGATREAFKNGLISDGDSWMEMIRSRNLSTHTYNKGTADEVVTSILSRFYPAFEQMTTTFSVLAGQTRDA
ncbi:nucleotidyltransferase substrate binding protein [Geomobilimonas luticola]|uniref:HI0074 family nucleotidyltransferase substrate-binding subunit n=1 Tax=Geomobilimonas luticola TaxID=1114878 RepID=A0ABS5SCI7_9BACT|nr:nucleotidyltransferase substrate binding protein [Geomobilimonas luticola]MBT0653093.1 HI0074 family nucleotidyltransferase substrate-binding subunit [Geomobilimonas luticola]